MSESTEADGGDQIDWWSHGSEADDLLVIVTVYIGDNEQPENYSGHVLTSLKPVRKYRLS